MLGRTLCDGCVLTLESDPIQAIVARLRNLDPGQDEEILAGTIRKALPRNYQRHQVNQELKHRPTLLTGDGAHGSPGLNALLMALTAQGVAGIVPPSCPFCNRSQPLNFQRDALRCCRRCYDQSRNQACSRCGTVRAVASRTSSGSPVCTPCFRQDPDNHETCSRCGRKDRVTKPDGGLALCRRCHRLPTAGCSICGLQKPCHFAGTDNPRCEHCSRMVKATDCSNCGKLRGVWTRTLDGQPLCGECSRRRTKCSHCQLNRQISGTGPDGPLCKVCYRQRPVSFRPCSACGSTERLHHHGLCQGCASQQMLLSLLSDSTGAVPTHLRPAHEALAGSEPSALLQWISKHSTAPALLAELSRRNKPLTHRQLDDRRPDRAIAYLRKILVTGRALPPRDEHLAGTELWAATKIGQITDRKDRQTIRGFATWHALRRLRQASGRHAVSAGQAMGCRAMIRAAIILTTELHERDTTLETCTQREIDDLLASGKIDDRARPFVLWATSRGHAGAISIPYRRSSHTPRPRIAEDHRWALVHHLLHDSSPAIEDRSQACSYCSLHNHSTASWP